MTMKQSRTALFCLLIGAVLIYAVAARRGGGGGGRPGGGGRGPPGGGHHGPPGPPGPRGPCRFGMPLPGVTCDGANPCPDGSSCTPHGFCCPDPLPACYQPPHDMPCRHPADGRYYYDPLTEACVQAVDQCLPHGNNFLDQAACEAYCVGGDNTPCTLTPDPIDCRFHRHLTTWYYYDTATMQCIAYAEGECGGNGNMFMSQAQCEGYCVTP